MLLGKSKVFVRARFGEIPKPTVRVRMGETNRRVFALFYRYAPTVFYRRIFYFRRVL